MGLMDGTYSYADLVRRYGQFRVPACKLKVDGREVSGVGIEQVEATLALEGSSAVSFRVAGAYDRKKSGFRSEVKARLKLGARVSLSLGYGSRLTEVFQGYIGSVEMEFADEPTLSVTAMDVRRLMMEGSKREVVHTLTSYSAVFQEVMRNYSALCPGTEVDATKSGEISRIAQRTSDYNFVVANLAKKAEREFFVLNDKAYFREKGKVKSPVVTLRWGESLFSFSRRASYQNLKITVVGFDPENDKAVTAQTTATAGSSQKSVGGWNEAVLTDPDAQETDKAKKRAQKEAQERRRRAREGSLRCVGLPELVPGRFVAVKGLDSDLDQSYYIREVRHELSSDGFSTSLEIGEWK